MPRLFVESGLLQLFCPDLYIGPDRCTGTYGV